MLGENSVLGSIRSLDYPDTPEVGAILRPMDGVALLNHIGNYVRDLDLFEKILELSELPHDAVRAFTCAEMNEIKKTVKITDEGAW